MNWKQFQNNDNRTTNVSLVVTGYYYETTNVKPWLQINLHNKHKINLNSKKHSLSKNEDKSIDLRLSINEATDFDLNKRTR